MYGAQLSSVGSRETPRCRHAAVDISTIIVISCMQHIIRVHVAQGVVTLTHTVDARFAA